MQLGDTLKIAAAGMKAQSDRLRVVAENIAGSSSTGNTPGAEPYRRQMVVFRNVLDRELGIKTVRVVDRVADNSPFGLRYDPAHPAANEEGYVLTSNVNRIVEAMDMREARRGYEANLNMVEIAKSMLTRTLELLRG